jgi:hypothetical protein
MPLEKTDEVVFPGFVGWTVTGIDSRLPCRLGDVFLADVFLKLETFQLLPGVPVMSFDVMENCLKNIENWNESDGMGSQRLDVSKNHTSQD